MDVCMYVMTKHPRPRENGRQMTISEKRYFTYRTFYGNLYPIISFFPSFTFSSPSSSSSSSFSPFFFLFFPLPLLPFSSSSLFPLPPLLFFPLFSSLFFSSTSFSRLFPLCQIKQFYPLTPHKYLTHFSIKPPVRILNGKGEHRRYITHPPIYIYIYAPN